MLTIRHKFETGEYTLIDYVCWSPFIIGLSTEIVENRLSY